MDVINLISKVNGLPDVAVIDPTQKYQIASAMYVNGYVAQDDSSVYLY